MLDALRAGRELDNFLNQFHYENDRKSAVEPRHSILEVVGFMEQSWQSEPVSVIQWIIEISWI